MISETIIQKVYNNAHTTEKKKTMYVLWWNFFNFIEIE